jgi:hypothetical protein
MLKMKKLRYIFGFFFYQKEARGKLRHRKKHRTNGSKVDSMLF